MAMARFSLRTLIVVMLLGGPVCAVAWWAREIVFFAVLVVFFAGLTVGAAAGLVSLANALWTGLTRAQDYLDRFRDAPTQD